MGSALKPEQKSVNLQVFLSEKPHATSALLQPQSQLMRYLKEKRTDFVCNFYIAILQVQIDAKEGLLFFEGHAKAFCIIIIILYL